MAAADFYVICHPEIISRIIHLAKIAASLATTKANEERPGVTSDE